MLRKALLLVAAFSTVIGSVLAAPQEKPANNNGALAAAATHPRTVSILRTTNKAQVNRYIPRVYIFKYANPNLAIRFARRFVQVEEGLVDTYVSPDGKGGRLLVAIPEYQVPEVDRLMAQMDRPGLSSASGSAFEYVQLRHRSVLTDSDGNGILDIAENAFQAGSNDTEIVPDPETNAVALLGPPSGVKAVLDYILKYDVPTPQVSISAKVYEIDTTNDGALGLDYFAWKNGPGRALFTIGAFGEYESVSNGKGINNGQQFDSGANTFGLPHRTMANHGANASYLLDVPSAFFDALSVRGSAKVLTNTKVSVISGVPAVFRAVEQIPFTRVKPAGPSVPDSIEKPVASNDEDILPVPPGQALQGTGPNNINDRRLLSEETPREAPKPAIEDRDRLSAKSFEEAGVVLWVTPTISLENIDLNILTSVADITGFDGVGVPLLASRVANTDLRAKNGEEIVLGGVTRDRTLQTTRKMPFLGSIPVLGYLFGGEINAKKVTTVVEVVQPVIIEDFSGVTKDDAKTMAQVIEGAPAPLPADEYGFDQYLLDPTK